MSRALAFAKINLALVVGPLRPDGKHELASVLQRVSLSDEVALEPAQDGRLVVDGFAEDTLVRAALEAAGRASAAPRAWRATIDKRIPVAAGLGGGSSDAASVLRLANALLPQPLTPSEMHSVAAEIGSDVPFFLSRGTQLATGTGVELAPLALPLDYWVVLLLPHGEHKTSTADVYGAFDRRGGADGFEARSRALVETLESVRGASDLTMLPPSDLASSPLAARLVELGACRAQVTGAGPAVYGLFEDRADAGQAIDALRGVGTTWLTHPIDG